MPLHEQIRVFLVQGGVRVADGEKRRQAVTPRDELPIEVQDGRVVWQLDGKSMIRYATHDLGELVPARSAGLLTTAYLTMMYV